MSEVAIRIDGLGKRYRIGELQRYKALRDTLTSALYAPYRAATSVINGRRRNGSSPSSSNTIWALKDVSFEVKQGEVVGIIGRNGAGKSTLLKVLSRITEPTEGYAEIHGRVGSLLEVGTGFHPELTGRENIYLNGAILGMRRSEINRKFDEIVAFAEVEKFIDTPVKHYSSGMYIRLAFAVAAHLEPEVLIVDEVLAVGDAEFQKKCLGKMGEVANEGRTVLFVSHNMGAIRQLCSKTVLLKSGQVELVGQTAEVVDRYLDAAEFADSAELNWNEDQCPGDEDAKLRKIRLCDQEGNARTEFGTTDSVAIELEYTIINPIRLHLSISIFSAEGIFLAYTSDVDSQQRFGKIRNPGLYISRCVIPDNLLNIGSYFISISGGVHGFKNMFQQLPQLRFSVVATGGPTTVFPDWKRPGVIAPALEWEVQKLGEPVARDAL